MTYVGFSYFDRMWPSTSHKQHCKSRDAKYLHLEDVEVKMWVSDHPLCHLRALQVAEGFHSTQHCFDDVCKACVSYECELVHAPHAML